MVAPLPAMPPPGPPQGPPPGPPGPPGGLAAQLPPEVLQRLLAELSPEDRAAFPTLPPEVQDDLLLGAVDRLGGPEALAAIMQGGPPPVPSGAPMPPPPGPLGPPPVGAGPLPPLPMPPPGPPVPGGGPPPLPGGPPGRIGGPPPPPIDLATRKPKTPEATGPKLPEEEPPPKDWEFEDIDDLMADQTATGKARDYRWYDAPDHDDVCVMAQEALDDPFWQERNNACYEQMYIYYRSRLFAKLNKQPFSEIQGDLLYMLSTPAKQVDRIVARVKADSEHLVFNMAQRSERKEYEAARDDLVSIVRDQWAKHLRHQFDSVSQHGPDASLDRKIAFLPTMHGTAGWSLRANVRRKKGAKKRDINADHPATLTLIPWHEMYQLGDITLRIQSVTLKEARRMSADVRKKWPTRTESDKKDGTWYPPDDHRCRLIAGSDVVGRWYFQCFDLVEGEVLKKSGKVDEDDARFWVVKPQRMDYGFCLFQCPPGWQTTGDNALPDERQPAENFGRNFARGALFANLEDFPIQDQIASAALSTFRYNRNPAVIDIIDVEARQRLGEGPAKPFEGLEGERKTRLKDEGPQAVLKHFADNAGDNFLMSMAFGQTADTFPAALGGGGDAQSGYDRRQMVENAQLLHVDEIRTWIANTVEAISRRWIELMWRLGTGDKKVFGELPFSRSRGGVGEGSLDVTDIEKAGIAIRVEYHEDDVEKDLRMNNVVIPRVDKKIISLERAREMLGEPEPSLEEQRVDEEMSLSHPAVQEVRAIAAMRKGAKEFLPFLLEALNRNAYGQHVQQPGSTSLPGTQGPNGPGVPNMPGVPAGGMPTAESMPPNTPMPPGM